MSASTDSQYEEINAAITQTVTDFTSEIDLMVANSDAVPPTYILAAALMDLCSGLANLGDELAPAVGPATRKLLAAMADYRDSRLEDR
jgi:hypothetical protein